MRKAFVEEVALPEPRFRDGLGIRYVRAAGTDDAVEVLRPIWDVGSMQNAIRQRVSRLQSFRQARFVTLRSAEVPRDDPSTVEVMSDFVAGYRLSQYLAAAKAGTVVIDTNAAVYLLRELLGALALLRESRGITHGAVGPERVLITPKGRVVVADYVLGPAIERLEYTRPRLWREFRVPVPAGKGHPKLDDKADVMQVGMTAIALLMGRPLEPAEFPDGVGDLVAALGHSHRPRGVSAVPPALIDWVKRAVHKDAAGKLADVLDARLLLESIASKQNMASGGAAALKSVAETFGRYAADLDAKAAAAAAEEARRAALAAQVAVMEAIRLAAAEAAAPGDNAVPAFTLLAEAPVGQAAGSVSQVITDHGAPTAADADPPVGWRVPEAPPVEDTLPTSPLIQVDSTATIADPGEFIEEVLDLTGLAGDDQEIAEAVAAAPVEASLRLSATSNEVAAAPEPVAPGEPPVPVEALAPGEAPAVPVIAMQPVAAVDEALAALEAETPPPPPVPDALPEWRLLADPLGAVAPTIDTVEPTESLEELVAEFAATPSAPSTPASRPTLPAEEPLVTAAEMEGLVPLKSPGQAEPADGVFLPAADEPATLLADAPDGLLTAAARVLGTPLEVVAAAPASVAPVGVHEPDAPVPTSLDVVLGLQEAQAAAQAALETPRELAEAAAEAALETPHELAEAAAEAALEAPREPYAEAPDIAAWSFVEELVHRDTRFEAHAPADAPAPEPAVDAPQGFTAAPALEEPQPAPEPEIPKLPADWFIEVGPPRVLPAEPAPAGMIESPLDAVFRMHAGAGDAPPPPATREAARTPPLAPPPAIPALVGKAVDAEPVQRQAANVAPDPVPDDEGSGSVFSHVAPSVRRVRAEARRRRWARIASSIGGGLASSAGSLASGVGAVASGAGALVGGVGRAGASAVRLMAAALIAAGTGALRAVGAGVRGVGVVARAIAGGLATAGKGVASGFAAAGRGAVAGLSAAGRGAAAGLSAAGRAAGALLTGAGALFGATARSAARGGAALGKALTSACVSTGRAMVRVLAAASRGSAAGVRALAAGIGRGAFVAGAGVARLLRALASGVGVLGRSGLTAASATSRAAARAASAAAQAVSAASRAAGAGAGVAGTGAGRTAISLPRRIYFVFSDLADRLPRPVVRPWYLAAALLVIVAVAGVPYAKSWLSTHAPDLKAGLVGSAPPPASPPAPAVKTATPTTAATTDTGSVRVTVDPAGADVLLDGMLQGAAPLTIENLSAGAHALVVRDDSGTVRQSVRVTAGQTTDVSLKIRPGWLAVFAPVKLEVLENGKPIGSTEAGRILAAAGPHTIEVGSQAIGFRETRQVEIKPGEVLALTIELPPATVEVAAPADAEILVDGQSVGQAPLGPLQIAVGTREFVMRHPTLGERRQTVTVTYNGPARISFE
jgi:hypothetical protein